MNGTTLNFKGGGGLSATDKAKLIPENIREGVTFFEGTPREVVGELPYEFRIYNDGVKGVPLYLTYEPANGTNITEQLNDILMVGQDKDSKQYSAYIYTENKIDLTGYSTLCVRASNLGASNPSDPFWAFYSAVLSEKSFASGSVVKQVKAPTSQGTALMTVDISDLSGEYYVGVRLISPVYGIRYGWVTNINLVP